MKKTVYIIVAAMTILAAGCHKDNTPAGMRLVAEKIQGGTKAMVDGADITWVAGETLRINGEDKTVAIDGDGAYIEGVTSSDEYRFIYPSSINSTATLDGDVVTVTIPATHEYNSDANGKQLLDVPMAGRAGSGSSSLYLKHLTAAIMVEITNHYGFAVLVDSIVVRSGDAGTAYQISGATTIDLSAANMGITTNASPTAAQKKVKMTFGIGSHSLKVDQGATKRVMVPVLPVGDGNRFSIDVTVHKDGDAAVTKTYSKTQGTGGAMGRAKLGYAGHTVGFLFSVSSTQKVIVSQGNLQYNKSTGVWSFAANQYETVETSGQDVGTDYANQNIVTLFGWATSGWPNGNVKYLPYNTTTSGDNANGNGYGPTNGSSYTFDLTGTYANADWGEYASINNGGTGKWRSLTAGTSNSSCEWYYLMMSRSVKNTLREHAKYTMATIGGKYKGVIFFPDNYTHPGGTDFSGSTYNGKSNFTSTVSLAGWKLMEAAGAVFLPAAGNRYGQAVSDVGEECRYWSVTNSSSWTAFVAKFNSSTVTTVSTVNRQNGCSVRPVMNVD